MGRGEDGELNTSSLSVDPMREMHRRQLAADVEKATEVINKLFDQRAEWKPREIQEEACAIARVGRGPASIAFNSMADNGAVTIDENFIARRVG